MNVLVMKAAYTPSEDLTGRFSNLDEKFELLQLCSDEAFFTYNNTLNEALQTLGSLIEDGYKLCELPSNDENIGLPVSMQNSAGNLRDMLVEFESQVHLMDAMLEKIEANFSLMFSPINNFRQNLAALKPFLIKLNLPNADLKTAIPGKNTDTSVYLSDKIIDKIIDSCPVFEENIFNIKKHLGQLRQEFTLFKESIASDIIRKYDHVRELTDTIDANFCHPQIEKRKLDSLKVNWQKVEDLNRNNLISQNRLWSDLSQIRYTHRTVSGGNHHSSTNGSLVGQNHPQKFRYIHNKIAKLQIGQLVCANEDYKKITEQLNQRIEHIRLDINELMGINLAQETDLEGEAKRLNQQVESFTNTVKKGVDNYNLLAKEIGLVNKIVNDLHSKYLDIDLIDNSVEQRIIDRINFNNLLLSPNSETASHAQQILKLYASNHFEKNKLKTLFHSAKVELKEFVRTNMEFVGDRKGIERIYDTVTSTSAHSEAVIEKITKIDCIKNDIRVKGGEINIAVNRVISSLTAHDLFERTVDQLVGHLESVSFSEGVEKQKVNENGDMWTQDSFIEKIEEYLAIKPKDKMQYVYENNVLLRPGNCQRKF